MRLCFSKTGNMSVRSQGVHSSGFGAFRRGIQTPVWPRLPACLTGVCVCFPCVCVCMLDVLHPVLIAQFSPSLPSLSLLHIKASIIHPTTLLAVSGHFLLCFLLKLSHSDQLSTWSIFCTVYSVYTVYTVIMLT